MHFFHKNAHDQDTELMPLPDTLPRNQILQGDCVTMLEALPPNSIDLIFADPPYNLQLQQELLRPNRTRVEAVTDAWDQFSSLSEYDAFTGAWLAACRRVLKDTGTIWVIGSYHNIFRVGNQLMNLGYWILNDVIWHKTNPMPNFRGSRFTNATETLIWAKKSQDQKRYTFNYHGMKNLNNEKQMPNVWHIPLCTGAERIRVDGKKAHSTQKPEALLYRVILSSSHRGDVVLDPFFGSGTTGAVAKKLGRDFIGIEREPRYIAVARARIDAITPAEHTDDALLVTESRRSAPRVGFGALIEGGYVTVGQALHAPKHNTQAVIHADGSLTCGALKGSIHKVATLLAGAGQNGWDFWHIATADGAFVPLNTLREQYRADRDRPSEQDEQGM